MYNTLFVATIFVVTFYVLYLCWKSKIALWKLRLYLERLLREEFYRP